MDYYSELGEGYLELHREEQEKKFRMIALRIHPKKTDKLLDVGCGPGWAKAFFDCRYTGIDPAEKLIGEDYIVGRGEELPFENDSFDFIICVSALHNMSEPSRALDEMNRVSKPGAVFAVTILKKSSKATMLAALIRKKFDIKEEIDDRHDWIIICTNYK